MDDVLSEQSVQKTLVGKKSKGTERRSLSLRTIGVKGREKGKRCCIHELVQERKKRERTDDMRGMNENNNRKKERKSTDKKYAETLARPGLV